jgi:hypothetical protein
MTRNVHQPFKTKATKTTAGKTNNAGSRSLSRLFSSAFFPIFLLSAFFACPKAHAQMQIVRGAHPATRAVAPTAYTVPPLKLLVSALPGSSGIGNLLVPVGGTGFISVLVDNPTKQTFGPVIVTASTGKVALPLKITMCEAAFTSDDGCSANPTKSVTVSSIPPTPDEQEWRLINLQVAASAVIANDPSVNQIDITFKTTGGATVGSAIVPVTAVKQKIGTFIATATGNIFTIPVGSGEPGSFAAATSNLTGKTLSSMTARADPSNNLPVDITLCQTNSATAQCVSPPSSSVTLQSVTARETPTFAVFVTAKAAIAKNSSNRIVFIIEDANKNLLGSASIEVDTN